MGRSAGPTWGRDWRLPPVRWVAHVDMDAFFASVEQLDRPELRGKPVIVGNSPMPVERVMELATEVRDLPVRPEFIKGIRGVVASASYEARAFGVRSAMPLAKAMALCPDATLLNGRFDRYRAVAEVLRSVWLEFSPVIEPISIDESFLDLTGCELYGGPVLTVGERLKERIRAATGLTASVGIAPNKLLAKIASDMDKPDGLVIVRHGEESRILAPLPVRALPGVGPRTAEALYVLGIGTCGQLAAYDEPKLAAVFGIEQAASLRARALGMDGSPVEPPGDPKSISRETTLAEDEGDAEELRSILRQLSDRVGWQLRKEGFRARCIYIKLRLLPVKRARSGGDSGFGRLITRQLTIGSPTDSGSTIYSAAAKLLDAAASSTGLRDGSELVRLIGVGTAALVHASGGGGDSQEPVFATDERGQGMMLFEDEPLSEKPSAVRETRLNTSVDAIRERFGYRSITVAAGVKRTDLEGPEHLSD